MTSNPVLEAPLSQLQDDKDDPFTPRVNSGVKIIELVGSLLLYRIG
jgi:hypothetical protein